MDNIFQDQYFLSLVGVFQKLQSWIKHLMIFFVNFKVTRIDHVCLERIQYRMHSILSLKVSRRGVWWELVPYKYKSLFSCLSWTFYLVFTKSGFAFASYEGNKVLWGTENGIRFVNQWIIKCTLPSSPNHFSPRFIVDFNFGLCLNKSLAGSCYILFTANIFKIAFIF